jgi:hypothetical protein
MTVVGQKLKSSMGAYVFRSAPESGRCLQQPSCPLSANKRHQLEMKEAAN